MLRRISDYYCGYNWLDSSKSPVRAKSSNCLFLCIRPNEYQGQDQGSNYRNVIEAISSMLIDFTKEYQG